MQIDGMYRRFWRQLCFDVPRLLSNAASRRRVFGVLITLLVILLIFSAFYGAIAVFEYKFGGGIYGIALVCISYALAFGIRKAMQKTGNTIRLGIDVTPPTGLHEERLKQQDYPKPHQQLNWVWCARICSTVCERRICGRGCRCIFGIA